MTSVVIIIGVFLLLTFIAWRRMSRINNKLLEANRQKDRIFSIISHDLASPVGNLRILNDQLSGVVEGLEIEHDVLTEISRLIDASVESTAVLLDNLLQWSRSQRNKIDFQPVLLPAIEHVNAAKHIYSPIAEQKGIEIKYQVDTQVEVFADINMIRTIIRNLLGNAVKFTAPGGYVSIEISSDPSMVYIRIKDTGVGMSNDQISKLFNIDTVQSTRGTESEKGSGLGLILCKEFTDRHGGTIDAVSEPGRGSEFTVSLPVV